MSFLAVSSEEARRVDERERELSGRDGPELVRAAAAALCDAFLVSPGRLELPAVFLIGGGDNGADTAALALQFCSRGHAAPADLALILARPEAAVRGGTALSRYVAEAASSGIPILSWPDERAPSGRDAAAERIRTAATVFDGLAGTGLRGPLSGPAAELVAVLGSAPASGRRPRRVVSIDAPSGAYEGWGVGDPVCAADLTLAVEFPKKACYIPALRASCGTLRVVDGIFSEEARSGARGVTVYDGSGGSLEEAFAAIPRIRRDAHKGSRGLVLVEAGSSGAVGAARIALRAAMAAGAGLVVARVDREVAAALRVAELGPVVQDLDGGGADGMPVRRPDALLVGPGWGRTPARRARFGALSSDPAIAEAAPVLVADADALDYADGTAYGGRAVLTPHPGEAARMLGVGIAELLADADAAALRLARERNGAVILKGHVPRVAAADGRLAYLDGNAPALAAGGSGDALAGLAAGLAARMRRAEKDGVGSPFDPYAAALAACALLLEAGRRCEAERRMPGVADVLDAAAKVAGEAWLPEVPYGRI